MQTSKVVAVFDCRKYNAKLPKEQWQVVADTDNVTCTVTYPLADLPDEFKSEQGAPDEFCRLYASKTERENAVHDGREPQNDRVAVRFKVGQNCRWFDAHGKQTTRPANTELDGTRYNVIIDYARKQKKASDPLAPSGYWANAIMFERVDENPFEGKAFKPMDDAAPASAPAPAAEDDDDVVFD